MLGLKLNHVSKRGYWALLCKGPKVFRVTCINEIPYVFWNTGTFFGMRVFMDNLWNSKTHSVILLLSMFDIMFVIFYNTSGLDVISRLGWPSLVTNFSQELVDEAQIVAVESVYGAVSGTPITTTHMVLHTGSRTYIQGISDIFLLGKWYCLPQSFADVYALLFGEQKSYNVNDILFESASLNHHYEIWKCKNRPLANWCSIELA